MLANENITALETVYQGMYITVLILLALMLFVCLLRAVKGPRIADRIVAVNMMGTMVMVMIAVLSLLLKEGFLVDICLIYAMVSFLAVIVITKVYMGVYVEKSHAVEADGAAGSGPESESNRENGSGKVPGSTDAKGGEADGNS